MYKIAIIEEFHKAGLELLDKHKDFNYEIINDASEENLIKKLPEFDGCTLRLSKLNSKILQNCKKLKVISRHGVGYDNVDIDFLKKNNITLLITSNANHVAVVEHTMYMILSIAKGIVSHDKAVRDGSFKKGISKIETFEISNKEILIIGCGRVGKSLVKKLQSFNMNIKIYDPYVDTKIITKLGGIKVDNLNESIQNADIITLHIPLNKNTKNLINITNLSLMKKNTILINTSRGGIVNEKDLDVALKKNMIFGAGLDVFEEEPLDQKSPLIKNKKILLSPHSATFTNECKIRMSKLTIQNIIDFFEKKMDKSMVVT